MMSTIDEIRERLADVTPGPWEWRGNVDTHNVHLRGMGPGRPDIMSFRRSGMQGAKPFFCDLRDRGMITDGYKMAVFEVCRDASERSDPRVYRGHVVGFRHPDATFIASARQDVDDLLAYIDHLNALLHAQEPLVTYALNVKTMASRFSPSGVGAHKAYEEYRRRMEEEAA